MLLQLHPLQTVQREPPPEAATTSTTTTTTSASNRWWYPDPVMFNATKDELKAMPEFKY
jgi:hypothetical protein